MAKRRTAPKSTIPERFQGTEGTCAATGKVRHRSRSIAKRTEARLRGSFGRMDVYACDACGSWHVGHLTALAKEAKRATIAAEQATAQEGLP